jgi:hypothetical protein
VNDTPDIVARVVAERYRDLTPAERVRMASEMYATAIALARAGIREEYGALAEPEMRKQLLRRLHGAELTEEQIAEICRSWVE